jgi:hypothetical protein
MRALGGVMYHLIIGCTTCSSVPANGPNNLSNVDKVPDSLWIKTRDNVDITPALLEQVRLVLYTMPNMIDDDFVPKLTTLPRSKSHCRSSLITASIPSLDSQSICIPKDLESHKSKPQKTKSCTRWSGNPCRVASQKRRGFNRWMMDSALLSLLKQTIMPSPYSQSQMIIWCDIAVNMSLVPPNR